MPTNTERRTRAIAETRDMPRKCHSCKLMKEDVRPRAVPDEDSATGQSMRRACEECAGKLWMEAATI